MGAWHEQKLRVRFEETDNMGVVYYAKFFVWMEVGRVNLLRDLGLTPGNWGKMGFHIPVVQAHADYKASARFDDEILVKTRIGRVGSRSLMFENEILKLPEAILLCTGHTVHAFVGDEGKSISFPASVREKLEGDRAPSAHLL
ncbi:MAG TPA: thioesterase family protein [Nitrososphaerales archaeon]|nr:thioesterase family protein [Nitrososphaerales archaeon]